MASLTLAVSLHTRLGCACVSCCPTQRASRVGAGASRRALTVSADSKKAVVVLTGTAGVAGTVTFAQEGSGVLRWKGTLLRAPEHLRSRRRHHRER